jgi:hypothetical protein
MTFYDRRNNYLADQLILFLIDQLVLVDLNQQEIPAK